MKAELLRKQDEVNKAKHASKNQIENFVPSSKFGKDKDDTKPSASQSKPLPPDAEESEALRKSKYVSIYPLIAVIHINLYHFETENSNF